MAIPQNQPAFDDAFAAMLAGGTLGATDMAIQMERVLDASRLWQSGELTDEDFRRAVRAVGREARLDVTDPGDDRDERAGSDD